MSAPDTKPIRRHKADIDEWKILRKLKLGPCRACDLDLRPWGIQLHHLVGRDLGGDDKPDNLVPLCIGCHKAVEERDRLACELLRASLTAEELSYVIDKKGWPYLWRYYPARRSAEDVGTAA